MSENTEGRARRTKTAFRMEYAVGIDIAAPPKKIWSLLTNAKDFPAWNTTVATIDGKISAGETIKLVAKIAPDRTFKLKVRELSDEKMVWSDGMAPMFKGVRTFTLTPAKDGKKTHFAMSEVFSGLMLPMIAGSLPDFTDAFETYAADLKRAAEK